MAADRPTPIRTAPFENMPEFIAEKYQGEFDGYTWYSLCSRHMHETNLDCAACTVGSYRENTNA